MPKRLPLLFLLAGVCRHRASGDQGTVLVWLALSLSVFRRSKAMALPHAWSNLRSLGVLRGEK